MKTYYQKNKKKILARTKKYYQKNKARCKRVNKAWLQKNRPKSRAYAKKWAKNNKEWLKRYRRAWIKKNNKRITKQRKAYYRLHSDKFKAKQSAYLAWRKAYVLSAYGGQCAGCAQAGIRTDDPAMLTLDHINRDGAQDRKGMGGTEFYSRLFKMLPETRKDIRVLCWQCQMRHKFFGPKISDWFKARPCVNQVALERKPPKRKLA